MSASVAGEAATRAGRRDPWVNVAAVGARKVVTSAATRQEILDGSVACLEAKKHAVVIQASAELGELGAAADGTVPKLSELGRTRQRSDVGKAAVVALGRIHRAEATPASTRQGILDGLAACPEAKGRAAVLQACMEFSELGVAAVFLIVPGRCRGAGQDPPR